MSVLTLDAALAGFQATRLFAKVATPTLVAGRPASLWGLAGIPGAGGQDATLNGATLSSSSSMVNGQLPHVDPGAGNSYLGRFQGQASQAGTLLLCDRLWSNGGYTITSTSGQNSTTPSWPARDNNASANGDGVLLGLEISSVTGAGTPTITISYTNQAGTSGRSAANIDPTVASSVAGTFYRIGLQAGDTGVKAVASLTLNASWNSGTMNLVAYRLLAALELSAVLTPNALDVLTSGFPRLPNGVVPFLILIPQTTTPSIVSGSYAETQG